jgi:hypothetical protein
VSDWRGLMPSHRMAAALRLRVSCRNSAPDIRCTGPCPRRSYGVRRFPSDGAPGQIWVADVFQHLLEAQASGGGEVRRAPTHAVLDGCKRVTRFTLR